MGEELEAIEIEATADEEVIEIEVLDLSKISFHDRTLQEWLEHLTIKIPAQPASSLSMSRCVAAFNDRYQDAYNCYIELSVIHSSLKKDLDIVLTKAIKRIHAEVVTKGHKKPAGTLIDSLAQNDKDVKQYKSHLVNHEIVKNFFEGQKNKLEKTMQIAISLSFNSRQSDKMYDKSSNTGGLSEKD